MQAERLERMTQLRDTLRYEIAHNPSRKYSICLEIDKAHKLLGTSKELLEQLNELIFKTRQLDLFPETIE